MTHQTPSTARPFWNTDALLCMSAAALACVLGMRALSPAASPNLPALPLESLALAGGSVSAAGGITMLTSEATSEDLLVVLDSRNEFLTVYRTESNNTLTTQLRLSLPELFREARTRTSGRP